MTHRFFCAPASVYESVRAALDRAWSLPDGTTCIEPAATAPVGSNGMVYVAIPSDACDWSPVNEILPKMLTSNQIQEVSAREYQNAMPKPVVPDVIPPSTPRKPRLAR